MTVGVIWLAVSQAASISTSTEAETGVPSGNATQVADSTASGAGAIKFGAAGAASPLSALPRIAWEGGPNYWKQFSKANAAGWGDPSFFPILVDSDPFSSAQEIQWDKSLGLTGYIGGLNEYTPWSLLKTYGMYYVGGKYTSLSDGAMPDSFPNLVGYRLGDETDGVANPQDGYTMLQNDINANGNRSDGRFEYNNYTQQVNYDGWAPGSQFVNNFTDAVSLDMYWYTIPNSSFTNHLAYVPTVGGPANPRSASSYGAMVRGLRQVDASDGKLQPIWIYIENLDGGPGEQYTRDIAPGELKGAAMSSIINEARGILWFNSAMPQNEPGGAVGNVTRAAEYDTNFKGYADVMAMGQVNNQIKALAPVINTQSYQYVFGANLDTMLKWYNGSAYIFAMCSNNSTPGSRTFTLPAGIKSATSVQVVDESRTLPASNGTFTDSFAAEYSYHIYKVTP